MNLEEKSALHDHEAERMVLGSILSFSDPVEEAQAILTVGDFSLDSHAKIFNAISDMYENGQAIDIVTVTAELIDRKSLEAVGGGGYIAGLIDGIPRRPSIKAYCQRVRDRAQRRRILSTCEAAVLETQDGASKTKDILTSLDCDLLSISAEADKGAPKRLAETMLPNLDRWKAERRNPEMGEGLSYGIQQLNATTTGMRMGEIVVIGARVGNGKTSVACQMLIEQGVKNIPCVFFSLEMRREAIEKRLWSIESCVPFFRIHNSKLANQVDETDITEAIGRLAKYPIFVEDQRPLTPSQICSKARMLIRRDGVKLVIVDYAQIISGTGKEKDERVKVMRASRQLSEMCKNENIALVVLSQIGRPRDGNLNRKPTLFDFKESAALEEDADTAILIHCPVIDNSSERTYEDEMIVAKQRNGPCGVVPVTYDRKVLVYRDRI